MLQTLCGTTSSVIFGSYLITTYNKEYDPMLFINMLSSSLLFFTGYFPTFNKTEDIVDQIKDIRYIARKINLNSNKDITSQKIILNQIQKEETLISLKSKWDLNDEQINIFKSNIDNILDNKMRRKDLDKNSIISEIMKKLIDNKEYDYIYSINYEGNRTKWFYGPNSRLYHNIGIFSYTITPIVIDIYNIGILNRNTAFHIFILSLFIIASAIKEKTSIIIEAVIVMISTFFHLRNIYGENILSILQ